MQRPRLVGFLAACLLLLAYLASAPLVVREHHYECGTLPADDSALRQWLETQPRISSPEVTRAGDRVVVSYRTPRLFGASLEPWARMQELGYGDRRSFGVHQRASFWPAL